MSLLVHLTINDGPPIALVAIRRTSGGSDPDSLNTYLATRFDLRNDDVRQIGDGAELVHRYGDGAEKLAAAALSALA